MDTSAPSGALEFFTGDPVSVATHAFFVAIAILLLFLLFYTLRDILLRTSSFWVQLLAVLLVGFLPIVGFLVYLLIRPPRTLAEREVHSLLLTLTDAPQGHEKEKHKKKEK